MGLDDLSLKTIDSCAAGHLLGRSSASKGKQAVLDEVSVWVRWFQPGSEGYHERPLHCPAAPGRKTDSLLGRLSTHTHSTTSYVYWLDSRRTLPLALTHSLRKSMAS